MSLTDEDITWAGDHIKRQKTHTYRQAAKALSEKYGVLIDRERLRSIIRRRYNEDTNSTRAVTPPLASTAPVLAPPLTVEDSRVLVIADIHAHHADTEFLQRALDTFVAKGSGTIIIAGDLFDFTSLGRFPKTDVVLGVEEELQAVGRVLERITQYATRVVICNGNHDERFARQLDNTFTLRRLVAAAVDGTTLACPVFVTEYDYVFYGNSWVIGHLSAYSRRPGEVARRIATKYRRHVAVGHDHMQGFTTTQDGLYLAISVGCMISTDSSNNSSLWYKERRLNDYAPVTNGFLIIDNSVPYLYNKQGYSALNGGARWEDM